MVRPSRLSLALLLGAGFLVVFLVSAPTLVRAQCSTIGPTAVAERQSFSLCGPYGYRYEWYGPRVPGSSTSRCLTIDGLERGSYEYVLVISDAGGEIGRCRHVVNAGNSTGGVTSCAITGPDILPSSGEVELCATGSFGLHTYEWSGPGGFASTAGCVRVTRSGTYTLTTRNTITGSRRTCTHVVRAAGGAGNSVDCGTLGPTAIERGSAVQLCAPAYGNVNYVWTRPNAATSTARCIRATTAGTYVLTITDRSSGAVTRCSQTLAWADEAGDWDDPDATVSDNCPRTLQYWSSQMSGRGGSANAIDDAELRAIAASVDTRSTYFNWTNDVTGLRQALNPPRPMTQRKRLARQYAALLANVAAGERNAYDGGNEIGLDVDTPLNGGSATTIGGLMSQVETMLSTGRGNFNRTANELAAINGGRGIGVTCE
jgi:hypothetical protein